MATFTDKIRLIFDIDKQGSVNSLKDIRTNVAEADGAFGKFKTGASSSLDYVKQHAGAFALGAGTALVGFGIKAVGAFTDTAKAAIDLGAATGLATEDASRWIAVGDDFEISAAELTTGLGRIGKELDSGKWEQYGIKTRDAGGNIRSTNDILLDTLAMLGEVESETDQVRIGNELFGKGYANLAPLIGKSREEYEKMLGAVEEGQVITKEEAKTAERMRLAQDALGDALRDVTLKIGEQVAQMAPYIEGLVRIIELVDDFGETRLGGFLSNLSKGAAGAALDADKLTDSIEDLNYESIFLNESINNVAEDAAKMGADLGVVGGLMTELGESTESVGSKLDKADRSFGKVKDGARDATEKGLKPFISAAMDAGDVYDRLMGKLDDRTAYLNVEDALKRWGETMADTNATVADQERAFIDVQTEMANYVTGLDNIPESTETQILTLIDEGKLFEAATAIAELEKDRTVNFDVRLSPSVKLALSILRGLDGGGGALAGSVGAFNSTSGNVVASGQSAGGRPLVVVANTYVDGELVAQSQDRYRRGAV